MLGVLEGTSSGLPSQGRAGNASVLLAAGASPEAERPSEPRKEIWFRRRVNLVAAVRELWEFRELTLTLAERDLRIRYKQALLGLLWAIIAPVVMMLAFTIVFTKFAHIDTGGVPYALFSYMGLLPWTFFSASLTTGGGSLVANTPLLNKLYCPREVFPIAGIADSAVDALIATGVLLIMFPLLGFMPKPETVYVPLLVIVLLMFTFGVTLAVSAVLVYVRDLRLVLPLVIQLGLFLTPVAYGSNSISSSQSFLVVYSGLNPLVPVIDGLRRCVLNGLPPQWTSLAVGAVSALLWLIGGFALFKRLETGMADIA